MLLVLMYTQRQRKVTSKSHTLEIGQYLGGDSIINKQADRHFSLLLRAPGLAEEDTTKTPHLCPKITQQFGYVV